MVQNSRSESVSEWVEREQGRHFCQCGCGRPIVIKPHHHNPSHGIPKYLLQCVRRARPFPRDGEANGNWKGGRIRGSHGYLMVRSPGHPFAMKHGYVLEHRLAVERHLRETNPESPYLTEVDGVLYLRPEVNVHHIDHDKDNNNPANLRPLTPSEHATLHMLKRHGSNK